MRHIRFNTIRAGCIAACLLAIPGAVHSEDNGIASEQQVGKVAFGTADSAPQAFLGSRGLTIVQPAAARGRDGARMYIRIQGPQGKIWHSKAVASSMFYWRPEGSDGLYHYEAVALPGDGADSKLQRSEKRHAGPRPRITGSFELRRGHVRLPDTGNNYQDRGMKAADPQASTGKLRSEIEELIGQTIGWMISSAHASSDHTSGDKSISGELGIGLGSGDDPSHHIDIEKQFPTILFDDPFTSGGEEWRILADADAFEIIASPTNGTLERNAFFSLNEHGDVLVENTTGDVSFVDDLFFMDRSDATLGIGTTAPRGAPSIHAVEAEPAEVVLTNSSAGTDAWLTNDGTNFKVEGTNIHQDIFNVDLTAPADSLNISSDGNLGVGTFTAGAPLHIQQSDGTARILVTENSGTTSARELFKLQNNGGPFFIFQNTDLGESYSFAMGATGHFLISHQQTSGVQMRLRPNGDMEIQGTLVEGSSRAEKSNVKPVDEKTVLAKLDRLPISEWNYRGDPAERHVSPMAEDFYSTFGLGPDSEHIAPKDLAGVALAATKALKSKNGLIEEKLQRKNERIKSLETEMARLKQSVAEMKARQ